MARVIPFTGLSTLVQFGESSDGEVDPGMTVKVRRGWPSRRWLFLILGIYLLLSLGFGAVNPLFEAPDEHHHYFTAQAIAETGKLPHVAQEPDPWTRQEAAQPPLYYLLASAVIKPFDTDQAKQLIWANPFVRLGDASSVNNTNNFVHTSDEEWPWQGYVLAAHLIRALTAMLGLGTLLCIYGSGRLLWPANPEHALLATAMVAFLPQFVFLHGSISNDPLVVLFCAAALWQLLVMWYRELSWQRLLLLAITIGLAILSKMAGLLLLLYSIGFISTILWRDRRKRTIQASASKWLISVSLIIFVALLVSGWLLLRNLQLYDDITATNQFVSLAGGDRGYTLWQVISETRSIWFSFIALFGWANIRPPDWVYWVWMGIVIAAVAGALLELVRYLRTWNRSRSRDASPAKTGPRSSSFFDRPVVTAILLAVWVLMVYAGLVRFALLTPAVQGRLLFPAILPLALALAFGLSRYRWPGIFLNAPLLALLTTVYSLVVVLPEAYSRPPVVSATEIPVDATVHDVELGMGLRLHAAEQQTDVVKQDGWVWLTLYWQADDELEVAATQQAPQFVIELFGQEAELVGKLQSYHGGGLYPATLWPAGEIIVDNQGVKISNQAKTPVEAQIFVRLDGQSDSVNVGSVKVEPSKWPPAADEILARIEGIELVEAGLNKSRTGPGETLTVTIRWQVVSAPGRELTTFVHLGDPAQPPLAQGDSSPLGGRYPTSLWAESEVIDDRYTLVVPVDIPPGRYPVSVGLYDPGSGARIPLVINGTRQPNDAYLIGRLTVEE